MIKVTEESYEWLLNIKDIKSDYIKRYIEKYIEELFNVQIDLSDNNVEFDLDSAALFGSIQNILESTTDYKIIKVISDLDTLYNKRYESISCEYKHQIALIGDLENSEYSLSVFIPDNNLNNYITDQELINLYSEDDEILLSLLRDKKGSVANAEI